MSSTAVKMLIHFAPAAEPQGVALQFRYLYPSFIPLLPLLQELLLCLPQKLV